MAKSPNGLTDHLLAVIEQARDEINRMDYGQIEIKVREGLPVHLGVNISINLDSE